MNDLIVISVDNMTEPNYFVVFVFNINRKTTKDFERNNNFCLQGFFYEKKEVLIFFLFSPKRSPGDEVESLT